MDAAAKLARQLRGSPRAKLEATRLELQWKIQFYRHQIKNLETMVLLLEEGIAGIKVQIAAEEAGGT